MRKLANEYKKSIVLLSGRVDELKLLKKKLEDASADPVKDPDVIEVKERLKPLLEMQKDLRTLEKEVRNYYDRKWWRSPEFTCNGKSKTILRFAPYVNEKTCETIFFRFSESAQVSHE